MSRHGGGGMGREGRIDARRRAKAARHRADWDRDAALGGVAEEAQVPLPDGERVRAAPAPSELGGLLDSLVDARGWGERLRGAQLATLWPEVVGEDLARRSRPGRLAGGTLVVVVASPQWAAQLRFLGPTIAGRAGQAVGAAIDEVRVVVGAIDDAP